MIDYLLIAFIGNMSTVLLLIFMFQQKMSKGRYGLWTFY